MGIDSNRRVGGANGKKRLAEATVAITASVEQVAEWFVDPDKVLLYAPNPVSGGGGLLGSEFGYASKRE